jgi:SAM-dependent methyltransferase
MADKVQAFYERHPYPPPVDDLESYRRLWNDERRRRADHHLFWPARPYREDGSVLVAGCGTSQAAKYALRWPAARVTGIDFSVTGVRATEALKRKYDLGNLEVHQLPIERVSELGATFDQIVCTGALHHLADPDVGLAALRDVLNRDGAMHLMVYAPYGRAGIYMMQELCRRIGVEASSGGIEDLVRALEVLPPGHPLEPLLREAPDFQDDAGLADALLNPRDRAYSVPQVFELVERAGLAFGRWVRQAPYSPDCGVMAKLALGDRITQLALRDQYAALELFRGTMVRHSFIAYRDADHAAAQGMSFSGDTWLHYVPILAPDVICVRDRLPSGMEAVLLNKTHSFTDIVLPIDARERQQFEAIDGRRTLGDIARSEGRREHVRTFFERLYRYDQVVFDTSGECLKRRVQSAARSLR